MLTQVPDLHPLGLMKTGEDLRVLHTELEARIILQDPATSLLVSPVPEVDPHVGTLSSFFSVGFGALEDFLGVNSGSTFSLEGVGLDTVFDFDFSTGGSRLSSPSSSQYSFQTQATKKKKSN